MSYETHKQKALARDMLMQALKRVNEDEDVALMVAFDQEDGQRTMGCYGGVDALNSLCASGSVELAKKSGNPGAAALHISTIAMLDVFDDLGLDRAQALKAAAEFPDILMKVWDKRHSTAEQNNEITH